MSALSRETLSRLATSIAESATPPAPSALEAAPRLVAWAPVLAMHRPCLMGRVFGHPDQEDGADLQTTPIIAFHAEAGYARSVSRWYRLGTPIHEADPDLAAHMKAKASPYLMLAEPEVYAAAVREERLRAEGLIKARLDA
jgi:hypothetical protein